MRIVNREEFLRLPEGILFQKFQPCVLDPLCIKGETILVDGNAIDFFYTSLSDIGIVDWDSTGGMAEMCFAAVEKNTSLPTCFSTITRDGLFDKSQLFAVWETSDIQGLNRALSECTGVEVLQTSGNLSSLMKDTADSLLYMLRNTAKISVDSAAEANVRDFVSRLLLAGKLPAEYFLGEQKEEQS